MTKSDPKHDILMNALRLAPEMGWTEGLLSRAVAEAGEESMMAKALFPNGAEDLALEFSRWADEQMLIELEKQDISHLRVRDKVHHAVWTRIKILTPHRDAVRAAAKYWLRPPHGVQAGQAVWGSADAIWIWAGDTSTDYNRYTKRGLLSGVISTTFAYWLRDESEGYGKTRDFLSKKINMVVTIGQKTGQGVSMVKGLVAAMPFVGSFKGRAG